ncbi:EAL domain-containing protein [Rhodoblastus acidophilus]|uniref:EAL domain-containing protein n=1 Tax=Rhodoblastus acidophilus TaxID=1074 RepID=A0A6N8DQY1_RHOAC|nr:EAL domain-containing protein [Rhodoblastus acidophilus]MCW2276206.1 diguanylate cyclase (GGDEF)-like protein [Rhodoblastus acidophilus]MTV32869.1 EAL domain-containing protein [Rhodoblastus acidophilus]
MPLVFSLHAGAGCGASSPCAERDCARLAALVRQMPLIALAIAGNALTLAAISLYSAPLALTVSAPLALAGLCACLVIAWRRLIRKPIVEAEARRILRRVKLAAAPLAFLYIAWAMALYMHAGPGQAEALVYSLALTGMFTIFALAQLPKAALLVGGMSLPGFAWLLITGGDASAILAGVNIFVVVLALFMSVNGSSREFDDLVAARACAAQFAEDNRRIANTDSLTGLANRRAFFAQMSREIARSEQVFMGIVDLDGFKPVNDLYGHALGDKVLCECAGRLRQFETEGVSVARLGGDEFGVVVNARMTPSEILAFGARICAALKAPVRIAGAEASISCSIGFARFPQDASDAEQLYERADFALYHGKQHHRGEAVLFTAEHETKMRLKARIEQCLRRANLEEEIRLEFQPLFDAADQSIVSFEALARWTSPELGSVSPSQFVPIAERSETIHTLTRTVLRKALRAAKNWPETVGVSLNLSVRDLLSPIALSQIIVIIETSGVDPARIDIEVTETSLLTDFEGAQAALTTLKRLGVKISLDDFGTGYSSLAYVHRLPLDKIKIDRSFVQEMQGNGVARDIIKSMIALIGSLNLHCVTEGVETSEQFDLLRKFGCNVVQGFLFSRPIPQDEVVRFIADAGGGRPYAASA